MKGPQESLEKFSITKTIVNVKEMQIHIAQSIDLVRTIGLAKGRHPFSMSLIKGRDHHARNGLTRWIDHGATHRLGRCIESRCKNKSEHHRKTDRTFHRTITFTGWITGEQGGMGRLWILVPLLSIVTCREPCYILLRVPVGCIRHDILVERQQFFLETLGHFRKLP